MPRARASPRGTTARRATAPRAPGRTTEGHPSRTRRPNEADARRPRRLRRRRLRRCCGHPRHERRPRVRGAGASSTRNPSACVHNASSRCRVVSSPTMGSRSANVCTSSTGAPTAADTSPYNGSASINEQATSRRAKAAARWVATNVAPAPPRAACTAMTPTSTARRHRAHRGRGGPFGQGVAIARPYEEPSGPDTDRRPERGHRFPRLDGQDGRTADRRRIDEPGLGDDDVGFELPDRFDQLAVVGGGGDHPSPPTSIEEMHDLLGHVVRFEREHHPGHVVHSSVPSCAQAAHGAPP